ncbi:G2/mitotic-specific cyclin [Pyrenophora tritici-repentis]|uniref:G2/mitotic-specific cyclin n=2 Tax=Pyrenophora tritici-repentis TaxID=45151 RepID=A0A2W1GTY2_9PLEO|nr:G2/mitotic-specific cyclin 3 [Pyrenophora tritici-repentis Pt-1C-BFP]EDU42969.1 G2/mitotic-specific cyclin 3 [Pyrenophora tritici-repentis Pt-1C-BFP]KAI1516116.1 G2/mitotic-specific cyclin [Pyrenophora tritici-repentis]KAI1671634.1 G2/mitotic-specific cyclin [Pyrenophora tritici-repentis]KAI1685478.1 G2/mitotic-specific cyclin [Pyrenophora tritici-repentis]
MDAKPQRPLRALRIRDENAQPQLPAGKTLHSRNKSTPALSAMAQVGGVKAAAAKRTVFGDVSNTTRQPVAKDDTQVNGKKKGLEILKDTAVVSVKDVTKSNALLKPAQRPMANIISKANTTIETSEVVSSVPKHITVDASLPAANARKVLSKKSSTAVFQETQSKTVDTVVAPASSRQALPGQTQPSSFPKMDRASAQSQESVTIPEKEDKVESKNGAQDRHEYLDALEEQARVLEEERNEELAKANDLTGHDQDEYWDEEDDETDTYYETEGFTTTGRSRGDNTTGGVNPVLAPRVTAKTLRELEAARIFVEANRSAEDIEDEQWDTSMVAEYGDEIFEYMHALEEKMKPNATYMDHQAEIQWSMRSVLMDWLVQVHNRFTLLPETLFLAVNYVDRFLSCKVVSLGKLQLVGATALFVAAKYEEINCPSVQEIVYMVDGAYTADEVLKAERFMLSMLQFELGWPGPMSFLRRISKADDYDLETRTLSKYFLEITVMDERFVGCAPSFLSAGAHCLARLMLKKGDWSQAHVHYSGYTLGQLRKLISVILECCENPQKHHAAVYEKYTDKRYKRASVFVETEISKGFSLPFLSRDSTASQTWRRK